MASFLTSLWESVFTPGPTPTLLIATNASFAALQVILLGLFLATYSAHFIALSFLSGGLWWAINWFSAELRRAQDIEDEAKRIRKRRAQEQGDAEKDKGGEAEDEMDDNGSHDDYENDPEDGTETETERDGPKSGASADTASSTGTASGARFNIRGGPNKIRGVMQSAQQAQAAREQYSKDHAAASDSKSTLSAPQLTQQKSETETSGADLSSSSMTDSEWEKVSEGEK